MAWLPRGGLVNEKSPAINGALLFLLVILLADGELLLHGALKLHMGVGNEVS